MTPPAGLDAASATPLDRLIAARDWSDSPLGLPETWPRCLRDALTLMLPSHAQVAIFWGPDDVALYNAAYAQTIGNKHPDALGNPAQPYWAESWDELGPMLAHVRTTGKTLSARDRRFYTERHGFGEIVYFDISMSPVRDEDGAVGGVMSVVSETTERVKADRRLRESEAALRASEGLAREQADELAVMYDNSPVGLAVLDTDLRYIRINRQLAEWNGIPVADHIGRHVSEIVPELTDQVAAALLRVLAGEPLLGIEITGPTRARPDGTSTWRQNWVPIYNWNGEIHQIAISCEDVSEERNAQAALETLNRVGAALSAEHDLERLVQMLTDAGVALTGASVGAFFHNVMDESGERLHLFTLSGEDRDRFESLGRPRATAVFAPIFRNVVMRSDDVTREPDYGQNTPHHGMPAGHPVVTSYLAVPVVSRDRSVLGGLLFGHSLPGRFTARHEELARTLAAQAAVAIDNAGLIADVRAANETLERRVEERTAALRETEAALRQSQKMEAMGQLTGGVAHDFNNLLTPIIGSLDLILRKRGDDPVLHRLLDGAMRSAERASTLVQRLLAFARRQPLQPAPVDMAVLVDGMVPLLASTLGPKIALSVTKPEALPPARADANQLEMALLNLAVNARDAMPEGGALEVRLGLGNAGDAPTPLPAGRYVRLAVRDTGSGMDAGTLARAIEPFFSTKGVGRGTGLGLSMVHGLASQLGGTLGLSSRLGEGTEVELWLPVSAEALAAHEAPQRHEPHDGAGTVLLVDDEDIVRGTAAEMLQALGYQVQLADSAEAALAMLDRGLVPDLLVTDHLMPGMTGTDLARAVQARLGALPTLIVSGYAGVEGLGRDFAHLPKPFRQADLARALTLLGVR
ncbi:PAS domain S-box protein [Sphingomonas sp. ABOLD]|uniref:histidine kinase n=1 Tax=Sphingomonas trueperi TaxID=53317 RepID=A0A7X5XVW4_9SPHN|nr:MULTISPECIES: PAS domain-containing protein [Sphingomonas]NJB96309.1 PAS domain S-box-containing protein [Sphingomonas trueperi]RSV43420.1 PAS domain S-box protein [Sphingomonas sp. ABOLD]